VIPRVLAVAASDSSGAAGLQADLKTFEARQVYSMSAVTAVTAQDSQRILSVKLMDPDFIAQQIATVLADLPVDAIKTGLLFNGEIVEVVSQTLARFESGSTNMIVDPVLVSGNGRAIVDEQGIAAYVENLFPRALMITPNLDEAAVLTGLTIDNPDAMYEAARLLHEMGPRYVLIKGGHLPWGDKSLDILYDGISFHDFRAVRLPIRNPRGTGCTFAACITAEVAKGRDPVTAVSIAKQYLTIALTAAAGWDLGSRRRVVFHSTGRPPLFNEMVRD
jgi:hydroxymethylpyrimidine kinase/phosphomethylpyrimidine kinase